MSGVGQLIVNNIAVLSSALKSKSAAGRGNSNKIEHYGIKKLRELILELAIRGMLVPQNPEDEPVSALLEKISKEKTELASAGKIKKQRTSPQIKEEEQLFKLPTGWEWLRLGEIGDIYNGNSISVKLKESKYSNVKEGLPFIATKDVGYGWQKLDYTNGIVIPIGEDKFKVAHSGAVLICAEGGSAGKKCGIAETDICFGNKLFAIELFGDIQSDFILANYLSPSFYEQFSEKMTGIIGGISLANLKLLMVPIPPLEEQHRIVAKVDELMALCNQLESEQTSSIAAHEQLVEVLLNSLTQSVNSQEFLSNWERISKHFHTLFTTENSIEQLKRAVLDLATTGRMVPFPNCAGTGILKDCLSFGPRNGLSPKEASIETPHKVLKLGATSYGALNLDETKYVDIDIDEDSHLWLKAGDILLQRGNSHIFVGSNVLIDNDVENVIYPDLMMKLRVTDETTPEYVSLWLKSPSARNFMWERMTGTSGTMPKISKKIVENIPIIIPPLDTQNKVVKLVSELMTFCDQLKVCITGTNRIQQQLADTLTREAVR